MPHPPVITGEKRMAASGSVCFPIQEDLVLKRIFRSEMEFFCVAPESEFYK